MEKKKSQAADIDKRRMSYVFVGLTAALAFVLLMISWTSFDETEVVDFTANLDLLDEEEIIASQAAPPPPPPPPPAPTTVIEIVEDTEEIEDDLPPPDMEATEDVVIEPLPEDFGDDINEDEVFITVEDMPYLPACKDLNNKSERDACTGNSIIKYITGNTKYPPIAKEAGITGTVFIKFVVNQKGDVEGVELLRGVNKDLDKEAIRVVKSLPKFTPGKQQGRKVKVSYSIPVKFSIRG